MKKVMAIIAALLVTGAIVTAAVAYGPGRGFGFGPCGRGEFGAFGNLNLTAEQKTKLTELRDNHYQDVKPLREQMFAKRDELRKLWLVPDPDQGKIAAAQKEMNAVREQMQDKRTAFRLESLKVLTPEQKEKAKSYAAGFRDGRGKGPGCSGFGRGRGFEPGAGGPWGGGPGRW